MLDKKSVQYEKSKNYEKVWKSQKNKIPKSPQKYVKLQVISKKPKKQDELFVDSRVIDPLHNLTSKKLS